LGLDRSQYSTAILAKIVHAGSNNTSFQQAQTDLDCLAELTVSAKQVRRLCKRIGDERIRERAAAVAAYQALPLVERKAAPAAVEPPAVVAVSVDGGRLQIFERQGPASAPPPTPAESLPQPDLLVVAAAAAANTALPQTAPLASVATAAPLPTETVVPTPLAGAALEEEDEERRGKFWREDKIGLLLTLDSAEAVSDPCPVVPPTFLHPARMAKLVRELKKRAPPQEEGAKEAADPDAEAEALRDNTVRWQPPEVTGKQLVATRRPWADFGPMVAAAAWAQGFFAAPRRAFVADGAENNWTLHRQFFSSFVPILDFIHGLSYVFAAAVAGRGFKEGWAVYERWIQWVWSGEVEQALVELAARQAELGAPTATEPTGSPRAVVARALTYLTNNQARMRYADYRRQGLPITSSYVESAVKQINRRVKGTEKFWNEDGAEELLHLRADYVSDGDVMSEYWQRRETTETGQNRYRSAK
jgi:hypothetical protein